jgi:hypothetical protein
VQHWQAYGLCGFQGAGWSLRIRDDRHSQPNTQSVKLCGRSRRGHMNKRRNFTASDDALIRQQPVTGFGIRRLAQILRTNQEAIRQRATELGVSLIIGDDDEPADTRTISSTNGFIDPLLERLKQVHGK